MKLLDLIEITPEKKTIPSITSFKEIDDTMIRTIIDYYGAEGYTDKEEAYIDFSTKIDEYKMLPNPVKLYRVIGVKDNRSINKEDLGKHWTPYTWNIDDSMLRSIGYEDWEEGTKAYIVEALIDHKDIDILQTLIQNLSFPNEHEITLKDNGKGTTFIRTYPMDKLSREDEDI